MDTAEILERAADLIDTFGWWNGSHADGGPNGSACALIAIERARKTAATIDERDDAIRLLRMTVGPHISAWNDASDHQTVTSTMRAVAATLRAQANTEPYARNDKTAQQAEICG